MLQTLTPTLMTDNVRAEQLTRNISREDYIQLYHSLTLISLPYPFLAMLREYLANYMLYYHEREPLSNLRKKKALYNNIALEIDDRYITQTQFARKKSINFNNFS